MHRNYFLFEKQVNELAPKLKACRVRQAFSYQKNELVLEVEKQGQIHFFRISVDVNYPYFLLTPAHKIKTPRVALFPFLSQQTIFSLNIQPHDKMIWFLTEHYTVLALFYGSQPNIFILDKNGQLVDSFKNLSDPHNISLPREDKARFDFRTIPREELQHLFQQAQNQPLADFIRQQCTAFNKTMVKELLYRLQKDGQTPLRDIDLDNELLPVLGTLKEQLSAPENYLYYQDQYLMALSPFPLLHLQHGNIRYETYSQLNKAWYRFVVERPKSAQFLSLKKQLTRVLQRRLTFVTSSLNNILQEKDLTLLKQQAELKGNLLLTFKHRVKPGAKSVTLDNIFEDNKPLTIKLDPRLSATENAQRYFNKYKNLNEQLQVTAIKRQTLQKEQRELQEYLQSVEKSDDLRLLQQVQKKLSALGLLAQSKSPQEAGTVNAYQFIRVILDENWDVYIGKNGVNNDQLTFNFAHKWDLWFHAQGVPGAHVIIRLQRKDYHPPRSVIEQAAALAAAYSKARHSTLVPVIYTQVRYVHRIRKAPPGTVSVQNEKVLFVKPLK